MVIQPPNDTNSCRSFPASLRVSVRYRRLVAGHAIVEHDACPAILRVLYLCPSLSSNKSSIQIQSTTALTTQSVSYPKQNPSSYSMPP